MSLTVQDDLTPEVVGAPQPIPPRRKWTKRFLLAAAIFTVALATLRGWWGWEAQRRVDEQIAAFRAAGQPVLIEDFQLPPVPDEQNAAVLIRQASALLGKPPEAPAPLSDLGVPTVCGQYRDFVAGLLRDQAETLHLLRAARERPVARWGTVIASPVINVSLPNLAWQRDLAKLLAVAAIHQHQTGDDAGAIESIRDMLVLARHVEDGEPFVITHLVRIAIEALAVQAVEDICRDLRVTPANEQPADGGVPRAAVHALIAELLDERSLRAGGRMSLYGERLMQWDCVNLLAKGGLGLKTAFGMTGAPARIGIFERLSAVALGPAWKLDGLGMMRRTTQLADAIVADDWAGAQSKIPTPLPTPRGLSALVRMMSSVLEPSLDRVITIHFRLRTERRMAATALAIRLFEVDHGRRPAALDELVPNYLTAIPSDPFAAGSAPLRYLPDAQSPRLYSVGSNGVDDGGAFRVKTSGGVDAEALDQPFFLNADRPRRPRLAASAPTTSPNRLNDDDDIEDGQAGYSQGH